MITVVFILAISAIIGTIMSAYNRCPLWVPVLLLSIALCLNYIPLK